MYRHACAYTTHALLIETPFQRNAVTTGPARRINVCGLSAISLCPRCLGGGKGSRPDHAEYRDFLSLLLPGYSAGSVATDFCAAHVFSGGGKNRRPPYKPNPEMDVARNRNICGQSLMSDATNET